MDNGSSDGSLEVVRKEFPTVQVIENGANLGFAKANNLALRQAQMYCEDEDWCFRAKRAGWKVVYNPQAVVIHHKGSSTSKRCLRMAYKLHKAIFRFHCKNMAQDYSPVINGLVYLGMGLQLAGALAVNVLRGKAGGKVLLW